LPETGKNSQLPKHLASLKNLMMDKAPHSPERERFSLNFSPLFSQMDFLIFEDGADRLSQNASNYHCYATNIPQEHRSRMTIW